MVAHRRHRVCIEAIKNGMVKNIPNKKDGAHESESLSSFERDGIPRTERYEMNGKPTDLPRAGRRLQQRILRSVERLYDGSHVIHLHIVRLEGKVNWNAA